MKNSNFYRLGIALSLLSTVSFVSCSAKKNEEATVSAVDVQSSSKIDITEDLLNQIENGQIQLTAEQLEAFKSELDKEQVLLSVEIAEATAISNELENARAAVSSESKSPGYIISTAGGAIGVTFGLALFTAEVVTKGYISRVALRKISASLRNRSEKTLMRRLTEMSSIKENLDDSIHEIVVKIQNNAASADDLRVLTALDERRALVLDSIEKELAQSNKQIAKVEEILNSKWMKRGGAGLSILLTVGIIVGSGLAIKEGQKDFWIASDKVMELRETLKTKLLSMKDSIEKMRRARKAAGISEEPDYEKVIRGLESDVYLNGEFHISQSK